MGYRSYEKEAGRYAQGLANRRPVYDDLNIDPYGRRRAIGPGSRQEDWRDILAHGERSDTNWDKTFRENSREMRRNYSPRGDWAKRKDMDKASQYMYDATVGFGRTRMGIMQRGRNILAEVKAGQMKSAYSDRDVAAAKWMAEYNRNLNIHERIALSKHRTKRRERFQSMQIQAERTERKQIRTTQRRGTSGLSTGVGAGNGLNI
jgi:hypothetical protein